ncbi:MAG: FKBP-type peptidyl-prolyl cis-trans isomerase [Candidatus Kapabacteria bacterium]|nr:FKBP-type peptidyl-prolyl cis-trans isomerase [Candidatus Kapabacteria bacterium]
MKYTLVLAIVATLGLIAAKPQASTPKQTKPTKSMSKETTTPSGLKYIDEVVGTGAQPKNGQTVVVHYTGTFANGNKFDSSRDRNEPFEFQLGMGMVIKGWDEGISTMKVGGKRKLIIPASLGYGPNDYGPIPGNSTLYFDVELIAVK